MELFLKYFGANMLFVSMLIGLICTLFPRFPGTVIIFSGAIVYGFLTEFVSFELWMLISLVIIMVFAEVGGRWLRFYLTRRYSLSPLTSTNSAVGNIAGVVASDALLGPLLGMALWQLIAGKTLLPRADTAFQVLSQLAIVATMRFLCGIMMILIIFVYIVI